MFTKFECFSYISPEVYSTKKEMEGIRTGLVIIFIFVVSQTGSALQEEHIEVPIIFIPGLLGSRLEARYRTSSSPDPSDPCPKRTTWHSMWKNTWDAFIYDSNCFGKTAELFFNETTGMSHNAPGVEVRVPGMGDTYTVENIDPSWIAWAMGNKGEYVAPLISELVSWGYIRGQSIRAAPYDFRYAPHSLSDYFDSLKALIEETYKINNKKRVLLFAHCIGGQYMLYFLRQLPQSWKDHYVEGLVTLGTPWSGAIGFVHMYAVTTVKFSFWTYKGNEVKTRESLIYQLPKIGTTEYDWNEDHIFLTTPNKTYTVGQIDQFFIDTGFPIGNAMRHLFGTEAYEIGDPGSNFHCIYSSGFPVPSQYAYEKDKDSMQYVLKGKLPADGDGMVSLRSLKGCAKITHQSKKMDFHMTEIANCSHTGMITDVRMYRYLRRVLKLEN